jgi:hypothetical protein
MIPDAGNRLGILSLKVRGSAQLTASSLDYGRIRS